MYVSLEADERRRSGGLKLKALNYTQLKGLTYLTD